MNAETGGPNPAGVEAGMRSIPPAAWPFILVGVLLLVQNLPTLLETGIETQSALVILASVLVAPLLPAAILAGCRDAWDSARLILVGAILWMALGPALALVSTLVAHFIPETYPTMPVSDSMKSSAIWVVWFRTRGRPSSPTASRSEDERKPPGHDLWSPESS